MRSYGQSTPKGFAGKEHDMKRIITIGREFGSGGRELGRRLAEELGFEYYDKEIISAIAAHTSLSESYVHQVIERTPHHLCPITVGQSLSYLSDYQFQMVQSVYQAQSEILRSMADKSDCVIVGRCADYILRDHPRCVNIFVTADMKDRICRLRETNPNISAEDAEIYLEKADKKRSSYYNYYSNKTWGAAATYHLCINSSVFGLDRTTEYIKAFIDEKLQLK